MGKNDRDLRGEYIWHLRPPFNKLFDTSHWWEVRGEVGTVQPVEALYELARRHPVVGKLRTTFQNAKWHGIELKEENLSKRAKDSLINFAHKDIGQLPAGIHCLCLIGLKSWQNLTPKNREFWEDTVGSIKGLDCRTDLQRCVLIRDEVLTDIFLEYARSIKRAGKSHAEFNEIVARKFIATDYPDKQFEAKFSHYAISALRQNFLLIAITPDLSIETANSLFEQKYREYQKLYKVPKQRARFESWLPRISDFENDESKYRKAKSQIFVRYRRPMDLIHFDYGTQGIVDTRCRHILAARDFFRRSIFEATNRLSK